MAQTPPTFQGYPRFADNGIVAPPPPEIRFRSLGEAWAIVRRDIGTWGTAGLVAVILSMLIAAPLQTIGNIVATGSPVGREFQTMTLFSWWIYISVNIIATMASQLVNVGLQHMALVRIRTGVTDLANMFTGFRNIFGIIGTQIFVTLLITSGTALLVIPGLYAYAVLILAPLIAADQNVDPVEAIKRSYRAIRGKALPMFFFIVVGGLVSGLGFFACCVGLIFTLPIFHIALALHYHAFFPPQEETAVEAPFERTSQPIPEQA